MSNAIAKHQSQSLMASGPASETPWEVMWQQAEALVRSGFLPSAIKTPEQAIAIVLAGDELGLPKMLALRSIHIIQGRPVLSADLLASLVHQAIDRRGDGLLMVLPPTAEACTVRYRRWGWPEEQAYTYTIQDAKTAQLAGKDTWKAHPAAMLRARATAAVCRMAWPDVCAGLYVAEELDETTPRETGQRLAEDRPLHVVSDADAAPTVKPRDTVNGMLVGTRATAASEAGQPEARQETAPPTDLEQSRRDLWALAKALGYSWDAFNVLRRELEIGAALDQMTASQVRLVREELESIAKDYSEQFDADPEQGEMPLDAEYVDLDEPGLDRHSA